MNFIAVTLCPLIFYVIFLKSSVIYSVLVKSYSISLPELIQNRVSSCTESHCNIKNAFSCNCTCLIAVQLVFKVVYFCVG